MKNRGFILPALTGFGVCVLFIFMSCASQEPNSDDPLSELGQENSAAEEAVKEAENAPVDENLGDLGGDPALSGDGVGLPSEDEMAKTAEGDPSLAETPQSSGNELNEDLSNDSALNDVLGLPSDKDIAKAERADRDREAREARQASAGESVSDGSPSLERAWSGSSRVPTIPKSAKKVKGKSLNRFYFVRKGDTPASVSELIYGSGAQASELKVWNKGAWKPGRLIFYASPVNPTDTQMDSFYKERGIQNGEYTVKKGDWLSKVAKSLLGHPGSWKEIAVINGLPSADAIEKGQRLAVYPADLRGGAPMGGGELAGGPATTEGTQPSVQPTQAPPPVDPSTPDAFQADNGIQNAPPVPTGGPTKKITGKKSGLDALSILKQESITMIFGGIFLVFIIALIIVNKRRKARRAVVTEDANDDIFGAGGQ